MVGGTPPSNSVLFPAGAIVAGGACRVFFALASRKMPRIRLQQAPPRAAIICKIALAAGRLIMGQNLQRQQPLNLRV